MYFLRYSLFIILCLFLNIPLQSQEQDDHHHDSKKNEIGGAVGVVYNLTEQHTASGFHLHYSRMLGGKLHNIGISPGAEIILGEDNHYSFEILIFYRPVHGWWIGLGPGITYFEHDYSSGFSGHLETGYEFEAGSIHFGPVLEYSWAKEDQHMLLGIHIGVPF